MINGDEFRLDIAAYGERGGWFEKTFFVAKIFNSYAKLTPDLLAHVHRKLEQVKRLKTAHGIVWHWEKGMTSATFY